MKYFCWLLLSPLVTWAQLPVPITPDWLKGGQSSAQVLHSTHVTLMGNNFRVIETNMIGKSRGFKLLGLITIKPASYTKAMSRLYGQAQIEAGRPQALANVVHESGSTFFILFSLPRVTVRADLLEFTDAGENAADENPATRRIRGRERQR